MKKTILLFTSLLFILCGCATAKEPEQKFVAIAYKTEYFTDGIVTQTDHYSNTYNDAGVMISSEHHKNGLLLSQESYEYDEFGNLVKVIAESNDTVETTEYKYTMDEEGHILRREENRDGELCFVEEFTYDKKGNERVVYTI